MRNLFKTSVKVLAVVFVLVGAVSLHSFVTAQEKTLTAEPVKVIETKPVSSSLSLGGQIELLAKAIMKFAEALNPSDPGLVTNNLYSSGGTAKSATVIEHLSPRCLDDWQNWDSSWDRDDDADWTMWLFPPNRTNGYWRHEQFLDVNGDGLVDYLHSYLGSYSFGSLSSDKSWNGNTIYYNPEESCVLLNNGKGWDIGYRCVKKQELYPPTPGKYRIKYYGDCADI